VFPIWGFPSKFDVITRMGGAGSQRSTILGFSSVYAYTLCHRTTKFDVVTHVGGACILGSATPSIPSERNDQVGLVNTYGKRRVTPLRRARLSAGQLRMLKELHEKTAGVRNPCSFRTEYAGGFAFEVNGEHGSVQG